MRIGVVAVVAMLLWPYGYWRHYGAFAGPFVLVLALPAGLLRPAEHHRQLVPLLAVSVLAAVLIVAVGVRQFAAETRAAGLDHPGCAGGPADPARVLRGHRLLIPDHQRRPVRPGRGGLPGHGRLLRDPAGPDRRAGIQPGLHADTALWRSQFAAASYVWLEWDNQGRIAWTPALYAYFTSHFRLLGVVDGSGAHDVPEGGLYVRR